LATARPPDSETESVPEPGPERRLRTFDALIEVPAFRWFMVAMLGNWGSLQMQQVVRGFLVYYLTDSYAALGGMALANSAPRLVLALFGGVVADRMPKRLVIQAGQAFNAMLTLSIATLLVFDVLRFEHLVISAVLQGISNSFTQPARQALIPEIVGLARLTNAVALNVSGMNTMRLVGPTIAGFMLAVAGFEWVYFLMTGLYVLAVIALLRVPRRPVEGYEATTGSWKGGAARGGGATSKGGRSGLGDIADALRYLRGQRTLAMLLIVHLCIVLFSMPFQRLLPGFVDEVLSSSETQTGLRLGFLYTATGVGALAGSLVIASMPGRRRGKLLLYGTALTGVMLLAFTRSEVFWVSVPIIVVMGVGQASRQTLSQVLIQTHVTNEYRGRISSIMMMEMGLTSFGTFGFGVLASEIGIRQALGIAGVALVVVAAVVYAFVPRYRDLD
jgi:MFS family permease